MIAGYFLSFPKAAAEASVTLFKYELGLMRLQLINILTLGNPNGTGVFFPNGLSGAITKPTGFDKVGDGFTDFPSTSLVAGQVRLQPSCRCIY